MATTETKSSVPLSTETMNGVGHSQEGESPGETAWTVQLNRDQLWLRLVVGFTELQSHDRRFLHIAPSFRNEINGVDKESRALTLDNWLVAVRSGLQYGFRTLRRPSKPVSIQELAGQLDADGLDALAHAAALAVTSLLNGHFSEKPPSGWTVSESGYLPKVAPGSTK